MVTTGGIIAFAGIEAPAGWLICDGRDLNGIADAALGPLKTLLGTRFNPPGVGAPACHLPNFSGRAPVGRGQYNDGVVAEQYTMAQTGGRVRYSLSPNQLPAHTHRFAGAVRADGTPLPQGGVSGGNHFRTRPFPENEGPLGFHWEYGGYDTSVVGNGEAIDLRSPYLVVTWIIKV